MVVIILKRANSELSINFSASFSFLFELTSEMGEYFKDRSELTQEVRKEFYDQRYNEEMKDIESSIDLNFLYAEFQKIYDGTGTISFKNAIKLALTEHPEISEPLFMYIFELIGGQSSYRRINWIAFTVVITECVRVCTYSER